jgi:acetyl esterase/lipase
MVRVSLLFALLAWGGFVYGFEKQEVVFKKIEGKGGDLKLHVYYPDNFDVSKPAPAIVFFFGGGWNGGTPAQFYPHCEYLTTRGMVAISAQYRTKKSHGVAPWQCVEDGKSAVRYVRKNAKKLGVKPDMIAAGGGSAGGHVAVATATSLKFDAENEDKSVSSVPNALALFNPVYHNGPAGGYGYDRVKDYWQDISPFHNIRKGMPATLTMMGTQDGLTTPETCRAFKKKMEEVGSHSRLELYEGQKHGFFNRGKGGDKMFAATVGAMDTFLASLGYLKGKPTVEAWLKANPAGKKK